MNKKGITLPIIVVIIISILFFTILVKNLYIIINFLAIKSKNILITLDNIKKNML